MTDLLNHINKQIEEDTLYFITAIKECKNSDLIDFQLKNAEPKTVIEVIRHMCKKSHEILLKSKFYPN